MNYLENLRDFIFSKVTNHLKSKFYQLLTIQNDGAQ